jgi:hypothetical protein
MPTGYTDYIDSLVEKGGSPTLKGYVWRCARAFGALVSMREEPLSAKIDITKIAGQKRKGRKSDSYHANEIARAKKELEDVLKMTPEECYAASVKEHKEAVKAYREAFEKWKRLDGAYTRVRDDVLSWDPPTKEHEGLKNFMLDQLATGWPTMYREVPKLMTGDEWRADQVKSAQWDIEYHTKELAKESEREDDHGGWLVQLAKSVGDPE